MKGFYFLICVAEERSWEERKIWRGTRASQARMKCIYDLHPINDNGFRYPPSPQVPLDDAWFVALGV